jgi:hypothetical protein
MAIIQPRPVVVSLKSLKDVVIAERERDPRFPKYADLTTLANLTPRHVLLAALFNAATVTVHIQRPDDGDDRPESIHLRSLNSQFASLEDQRFPKGFIAYLPETGRGFAYYDRNFLPVKITIVFHDDNVKREYSLISDFIQRDEYFDFRRTGPAELFSVFDCFVSSLDPYREYPIRVFFKKFEHERPDILQIHTATIPLALMDLMLESMVFGSGRRHDDYWSLR